MRSTLVTCSLVSARSEEREAWQGRTPRGAEGSIVIGLASSASSHKARSSPRSGVASLPCGGGMG